MTIRVEQGAIYWCPNCESRFSNREGDMAICPRCRYKRDDGLNLLEDSRFQCVVCGSKFPNLHQNKKPVCVNGCKYEGG